jgi:hypothetical protein
MRESNDMGTQNQTSGDKPKQTPQPGQHGTPNPQHEQRKDRENQPGGHEKGGEQQGSGGKGNDR